jgi:hypothetical protein
MSNTVYKGNYYSGLQGNIPELVEEGYYGGLVRKMYDSFVLTADLASGDTILMGGLLPEGARLVDCTLTSQALGGSCTINVGWKAGATGLEAAAPTAFFSALPVSSATVAKAHGSTYEGSFYQHVLLEQVQPVIAENAVSSGGTGQKIQVEIDYITE